jgi:hypothetical protein
MVAAQLFKASPLPVGRWSGDGLEAGIASLERRRLRTGCSGRGARATGALQ